MWTPVWSKFHTMKTVQIVLDEASLRAADREAKRARMNRSALFRTALAYYLRRCKIIELEERQRRGYEALPADADLDAWDRVQAWPAK